jgi:IS605 OrfB family transposase
MRGDIEFKGSSIHWKDGKLFVNISHDVGEMAKVSGKVTATFAPGTERPATLFYGERDRWIGGDGRIVSVVRRQLMTQRWSRQQTYRKCASSSRKGHGRHRGLDKVTLLSNRWRDFVKTFNRNMTAEIVRICQYENIGELTYERADKTKMFLTNAGKSGDRDSSGWDWFQLEKMIQDKLGEIGVKVKFVDVSDDKDEAGKELETASCE